LVSASDDARAAIAAVLIPDGVHVKPSAAPYVLDVPMPDGRTIAQVLDDGEEWRQWARTLASALDVLA
jgi:hypothetical protein